MAEATWNKSEDLADARAAATTYGSASVTYGSSTVYYSGYNPTGITAEDENPADWNEVDE